jgi:hypothetical protein
MPKLRIISDPCEQVAVYQETHPSGYATGKRGERCIVQEYEDVPYGPIALRL